MRALLLLALAACGSTPAPPAEPLVGHAELPPEPRATPAPAVVWNGAGFTTTLLPAVARAGELAVVEVHDGDGGRGFPNLRFEVRDRGDQVVQRIPVMTSSEFETLVIDGAPGPVLVRRLTEANRALALLHELHDLVPMHALEVQPPADGNDPHLAIGGGLDVDWNVEHLHVFPHNSDHPLAVIPGGSWLVAPHRPCAGCELCENPALLRAAYRATGIPILVVVIGFRGTDTCWEPGDQPHVVAW